jgi:hypothetical protein
VAQQVPKDIQLSWFLVGNPTDTNEKRAFYEFDVNFQILKPRKIYVGRLTSGTERFLQPWLASRKIDSGTAEVIVIPKQAQESGNFLRDFFVLNAWKPTHTLIFDPFLSCRAEMAQKACRNLGLRYDTVGVTQLGKDTIT